ncbi:MAG TPA: GntR family transcriptional regulator [Candidatus Elarobacter sp.]|jgi:DNA-binding GntR family transcriptional regulator
MSLSKHEPQALKRANVSDAVADAVRAMIVDGRLGDGERLNEVRLAERLGVSRTPVREALGRLAAEGALTSTPSRGYSVRPLTASELQQLYELRPLLDPHALRLAGIPPARTLDRLEKLNRALAATADPLRAIAVDDDWHRALIAHCPNLVLVELIESLMRRTRRYEIALMRERRNAVRATGEHARILAALHDGDLDAACAALKRNMETGGAPIVAWLREREPRVAAERAS